MNYVKPAIVLAGSTIAEIQGTGKGGPFLETLRQQNDTVAAYEADE
jgi:hypothetical protein